MYLIVLGTIIDKESNYHSPIEEDLFRSVQELLDFEYEAGYKDASAIEGAQNLQSYD